MYIYVILISRFLDPDPKELAAEDEHMSKKFQKLNQAIATLVSKFTLLDTTESTMYLVDGWNNLYS